MKNMKLGTKLAVGFGICISIIVALSGSAIFGIEKLRRTQDVGASRAADAINAMSAAAVGNAVYSVVADAVINRDLGGTMKVWAKIKEDSRNKLVTVAALVDTPQEKALMEKAQVDYAELVANFENDIIPLLKSGGDAEKISAIDSEIDKHKTGLYENLSAISASLKKGSEDADATFDTIGKTLIIFSIAVSIIGALAAVVLAFFIARSITRPIRRVIEGLTAGAEQVASAAGQVSSASQSLAQGASEQASSIEETSASLEEMSSMTQQNAANAEESASASEEMNAQAEQMKAYVEELVALVGGSDNGNDRPDRRGRVVTRQPITARKTKTKSLQSVPHVVAHQIAVNPADVIPLEDDFKDF